MGYKVTARLRIDLSEIGTDNNGNPFFAELQHPKLLTFGQQMELAKIAPAQKKKEKGPDGQEIEPDLTEEEKAANLEKTKEMAKYVQGFLKAWNLIDIEEPSKTVPTDGNPFDHVPSEAVQKIFTEFTKAMNQRSEETKNS